MPKPSQFPALLSLFLFTLLLSACSLMPTNKEVDDYGPMPAATADEPDPAADRIDPTPVLPRSSTDSPEDLWQRLRDGYQLTAPMQHPRIVEQRDKYANFPTYVYKILERGSRYLYHIVQEAEARDMPLELALLPMVESAFDPFAYSRGHAAGPWQFIGSTGRAFGLQQDWWKDDRRDILASTDAALAYLEQLSKRFDGDWLLALASYNAGGGNVSRSITRNKHQNKPTDFWNLTLPRETMDYVPKLLAVAELIRDPERYGIKLPPLPNEPYFETVDLPGQLHLETAAKLAQIPLEEVQLLNPAFNRHATAPSGPHRLLLPADKASAFHQQLAELPEEKRMPGNKQYIIQPGDTLIGIARQHGITVAELKTANKLANNTIVTGRELTIPSRGDAAPETKQHVVTSGDTLWHIAKQYKVSVQDIKQWNQLGNNTQLRIGQTLSLNSHSAPSTNNEQMVKKVNYQIRRGDTLSGIAQRFKVGLRELRQWNPQQNDNLTPGKNLVVYVDVRNIH